MKKRILSFVLVCLMLCTMLPMGTISVNAAEDYRAWEQSDSRWGSIPLGTSSCTVASDGCLVTSVTKLIIQAGFKDPSSFNVGTLARWLNNNSGYVAGTGNLYYGKPAAYVSGLSNCGYIIDSGNYSSSNNNSLLLDYVKKGYHMSINVNNGGHWVAVDEAKSLATGQIYIMDSLKGRTNADITLASRYSTFKMVHAYKGGTTPTGNYTISFSNTGDTSVSSITVTPGSSVTLPSTVPHLFGSDFEGWTYNGVTYQPGQTFTPTGNMTLTADWYVTNATVGELSMNFVPRIKYPGVGFYANFTVEKSGYYVMCGHSVNATAGEGTTITYTDNIGYLYDGNGNLLASNDDGPNDTGKYQFQIVHYLYANTQYVFKVDPYSQTATGSLGWYITRAESYVDSVNLGNDFYAHIEHLQSGLGVCNVEENVELGEYDTTSSLWHFIRQSDNSYEIVSTVDGLAMDVYDNITENETNVQTYSSNSTSAQRWYITEAGNGYSLISVSSLKALNIQNGDTAFGTNAVIYTPNESDAQIFEIEKVSQPGFTASTNQIKLRADGVDSQTIVFNSYGSFEDSIGFSWSSPTLSCTWGEWDGSAIPLTVTADSIEDTYLYVKLYYYDTEELIAERYYYPTLTGVTHRVIMDAMGGTFSNGTDTGDYTLTEGQSFSLESSRFIPQYFGKNFKGWATSAGSDVVAYAPSDVYRAEGSGVHMLYAVWEDWEVTGNSGQQYFSKSMAYPGQGLYFEFTVPVNGDYRFRGASSFDTKIKIYDADGTLLAEDDDSGEGTQFQLQSFFWSDVTYVVYVQPYSSTQTGDLKWYIEKGYDVLYVDELTNEAFTDGLCYVSDVFGNSWSATITSRIPTKAGYTFLGWNIDPDATTALYQPGETVILDYSNASFSYHPAVLGHAELYAIWEKDEISGTCGDNLTWILDDEGTLTIMGSGPMADYSNSSEIPWWAHSSSIREIIIGDGVTTIGDNAFYWCNNLTSVTIPDSIVAIGEWSFYRCNLSSVTIPNSVTDIAENAFVSCSRLISIEVNGDNPCYSSDSNGVLYSKDKTKLIAVPCAMTGAYTVPVSVDEIGDYAFYGNQLSAIWVDSNNSDYSSDSQGVLFNKNKTQLLQAPARISGVYTVPYGVQSIAPNAFYLCTSLTGVIISDSVTTVGDYAFNMCRALETVSLGCNVTTIGEAAFQNLNNLSEITIPVSVTTISDWAFNSCSSLADVYYGGTSAQWREIAIGDMNSPLANATIYTSVRVLTGIIVKTQPNKIEYWVGESLETAGLTLSANYTNGTTEIVTTGFAVSGFDANVAGQQTITVTYGDFTTNFTVNVKDPVMTGITVKTQPTKTEYWVGESLDTTGLTLTATYSDGSTQTVTEGFTVSGFVSTTAGTKTVTVTYEGKTTTFTVTVKTPTVTDIIIKTQPSKTEYWVGESLDTTGLTLTATYSDGSTETVTEGFTVSGFDSETAGTKTVTVTHEGKTATFTVQVKEAVPDENAPKIIVGTVRGVAGNRVSVDISLENNPGLVSATLQVDFDDSVLTLVDVQDKGVLGSATHKPEKVNPYILRWANNTVSQDYTVNGAVVTLVFEIKEGAGEGTYPISVSYDYNNYDIMNWQMDKVQFSVVNGSVTVIDVVPGDVNGDGNVDNRDSMILDRYLAKWDGYTVDVVAADVNIDGSVNNLDSMILARYLAKWEGYETLPYVS